MAGKGKKSRRARGYKPPMRKIMRVREYRRETDGILGHTDGLVPPKRIKNLWRAQTSGGIPLKVWLRRQHEDDLVYLGAKDWLENKQARFTRKPGKVRKLGRVQA